ncbi:hypothetical protein V6Z11_A13G176500 [Gossypium hirsutum]
MTEGTPDDTATRFRVSGVCQAVACGHAGTAHMGSGA